jgi:hypothetical protein
VQTTLFIKRREFYNTSRWENPPRAREQRAYARNEQRKKKRDPTPPTLRSREGYNRESPKDILEPIEMNTEETRTSPLATCNSVDRSGGSAR